MTFIKTFGVLTLMIGIGQSCGQGKQKQGYILERSALAGAAAEKPLADSQALNSVSIPIPKIPPVKCAKPRTNQRLVSSLTQDLFGRPASAEELKRSDAADFNFDKFVDESLSQSEADNGYTRFINNLFKVDRILPAVDANGLTTPESAQQAADLKLEPSMLFLRNKAWKWSKFWNTSDFYCTEATAKLYGLSVVKSNGFISCVLPPERKGFYGLISVLRATSPKGNPTAFYMVNNNYRRVAALLYFEEGMQLLANTNGPKGDAKGIPMPECVPTTDQRRDAGGLIYGTAAVPLAGATCAGCHSIYNGPLSIAFRRFDEFGGLLQVEDMDRLGARNTSATPVNLLKSLLAEQDSCWSPDGISAPAAFTGLAGLADLVAKSPKLGQALGDQVPRLLANITPDENSMASVAASYYLNGETLQAAFRGFFTSESNKCEIRE